MSLMASRRGAPRVPPSLLISSDFELTPTHAQSALAHMRSGESLGVTTPNLKSIRASHHRLAQLLAAGMDETKAGRLCNYAPSTVSILKSDPAFSELLTHYSTKVEEEFDDFISAASALTMDFLGELQARLHNSPDTFKNPELLDAVRTLADRTGHGVSSTTKSTVDVRALTAAMTTEQLNEKLDSLLNLPKAS